MERRLTEQRIAQRSAAARDVRKMISFIDKYATAIIAGAVTVIALLGAKLYECQRRLDAAEAKAGDYDALNRRLTEAKSLYYQRERTVAMAQKELVESARKRKAAEAKAEKLLQERDAARELSKDFAATTRVVEAMQNTTARLSRELADTHSIMSKQKTTIEEYKEALKLAAAGEVEKMRDELECMREELEEAKRDRELAINFAGGAADDVAKAAAEEAEALREKAAAAREHAISSRREGWETYEKDSLNIRVRDATGEETFFKIKKTTKMFKVFNAWCTRKGKPVTAYRFLFDGQRVDGEQTAEDIDMEDGDQIDCVTDLLMITIKWAPSDSTRPLTIPATSTVADLRTALGVGAGPRFVFLGRMLDDDSKTLVEYGVESGITIIAQGRPEQLPAA